MTANARLGPGAAAEGDALRRALENAAAEWRTTFDTIPSPVLVLDAAGVITRLNRAARDLTPHDYPTLIGTPASAAGGGPLLALAAELAAEVSARPETVTPTPARRVADPSRGTVWSVVARLRGRDPEVSEDRVIVVASDITRIEALQERVRQAETLAAQGAAVAGLAHQVRNPLFGLSAALDALDARYGADAELRRYVGALREPVDRLGTLLSQLVEYAAAPAGAAPSTDLAGVTAAALHAAAPLAAQRDVTLAHATLPSGVAVRADGHRLRSALAAILGNAIVMSPAGATVEVDVAVMAGTGGERARWRIRDHGPGFAAEDLPRLGEPFFSRRHGGTGLGLALVKRVASESGGAVAFANHAAGGAEVELILPLADAAGEEA